MDGDTIRGTIVMDFDVAIYQKEIRAFKFDAWENSRRRQTVVITDEELRKGKLAKQALENLIKGKKFYVAPGLTDPYGRISGTYYLDIGEPKLLDIGKWMTEAGHARF